MKFSVLIIMKRFVVRCVYPIMSREKGKTTGSGYSKFKNRSLVIGRDRMYSIIEFSILTTCSVFAVMLYNKHVFSV